MVVGHESERLVEPKHEVLPRLSRRHTESNVGQPAEGTGILHLDVHKVVVVYPTRGCHGNKEEGTPRHPCCPH